LFSASNLDKINLFKLVHFVLLQKSMHFLIFFIGY